jgi:hypothetical protein
MWSGCLALLLACAGGAFAEAPKTAEPTTIALRGKLTQTEGKPPALETAQGKRVPLEADKDSLGVLNDARLAGAEMELRGHFAGEAFRVDPIHTHALHVHKDGKRLAVTYWCDICAIRYHAPGLCWCCQNETALDLREPEPDDKE